MGKKSDETIEEESHYNFGGLHNRLKKSKIAKHTSEFLQRRLTAVTLKHLKSTTDDDLPIIIHFNHHNRPCRDSDSIMSNSSAATTSTWRATLGPEDNDLVSSLSPKQIKYQELLHELIMTEEAYLADLQLVQQVFIADLESTWHNLPESIRKTFESLHTIVQFHIVVLADLRECQHVQHPLIVGDVVERFRGYIPHIFDVYKEYFVHFELANDLIAKSLSNPETACLKSFGSYVQERCVYQECRSLTLQSFLLKPVQRLMKYPLFLKSQIECFEENDVAIQQHVQCMSEMDMVIRNIEDYKNQMEQAFRLSDLGERIRNLQEMGIQLNQPHRRLIHEGPLILHPSPQDPNVAPQRSFSKSSRQIFYKQKQKPLYVFLFNDLILFTKIRSKRISQGESELRTSVSGGGKLYGPAPDILFKLAAAPGQVTHLDRNVLQSDTSKNPNRSAWFGSFCRSSSRKSSGGSLSRSYHNYSNAEPDVHPLQFTCSIASRNVVNMLLETKTAEDKKIWCDSIESVRDEHCQRDGETNSHRNGRESAAVGAKTFYNYENSFQSISTMPAPLDDDAQDDSEDELSSIYSSIWDESYSESFHSSLFTEPFIDSQPKVDC
ncbi:Dbl homology domain-containing protein [Fennellomyces sp. T-0311]|nr:Dbl homology domain-containing protein [Fennellomyces sp. T-0311]